ncbi:hypothetical protein V8C34DRAFT_273856 [Trichoderma compactum]
MYSYVLVCTRMYGEFFLFPEHRVRAMKPSGPLDSARGPAAEMTGWAALIISLRAGGVAFLFLGCFFLCKGLATMPVIGIFFFCQDSVISVRRSKRAVRGAAGWDPSFFFFLFSHFFHSR